MRGQGSEIKERRTFSNFCVQEKTGRGRILYICFAGSVLVGSTPLPYRMMKRILGTGKNKVVEEESEGRDNRLDFYLFDNFHEGVIQLLLKRSEFGLYYRDQSNNTPLHSAAMRCSPFVEYLITQKGLNPNCRNDNKETPLFCSIQGVKDNEIIQYKFNFPIDKMADLHLRNLAKEIEENKINKAFAILSLLKCGADPNLPDNTGVTPLMKSVVVNAPKEVILMLLQYGANPYCMDDRARDMLDYIEERFEDDLFFLVTRVMVIMVLASALNVKRTSKRSHLRMLNMDLVKYLNGFM